MGKPSTFAQAALSMQAAKLRRDGHTNRSIAEITGLKVEQIPGRIKVCERLLTLDDERKGEG